MSFFTHHSRHSWPPYTAPSKQARNRNVRRSEGFGIDENPFSYFISPALDDEHNPPEEFLTAGIDSEPSPRPRSPFRRRHDNESSVTEVAKAPAAVLRRWIKYMEIHHPHIYHGHQVEPPPPKPIVPFIPPRSKSADRGRESARSIEIARGRKQARSRSGRPRSWREPSADLWPVSEACEGLEESQVVERTGEEIGLDISPARETHIRFVEDVG